MYPAMDSIIHTFKLTWINTYTTFRLQETYNLIQAEFNDHVTLVYILGHLFI